MSYICVVWVFIRPNLTVSTTFLIRVGFKVGFIQYQISRNGWMLGWELGERKRWYLNPPEFDWLISLVLTQSGVIINAIKNQKTVVQYSTVQYSTVQYSTLTVQYISTKLTCVFKYSCTIPSVSLYIARDSLYTSWELLLYIVALKNIKVSSRRNASVVLTERKCNYNIIQFLIKLITQNITK